MTASVAPAGGTGVGGIRRGVAAALASASAALAALWRRVVPVVSRAARPLRIVTPLGWGLIILGLIAAGVGSRFGWGELIAIAAGCAAAVVFAVPFVLGRSTFAARTELATSRVVVGERAVAHVRDEHDLGREIRRARRLDQRDHVGAAPGDQDGGAHPPGGRRHRPSFPR